jgi:hypothetical protein
MVVDWSLGKTSGIHGRIPKKQEHSRTNFKTGNTQNMSMWMVNTKNVGRGFPALHVLPSSTVSWLNQLKFEDYPLVIQRSYGKSQFLIGKSS